MLVRAKGDKLILDINRFNRLESIFSSTCNLPKHQMNCECFYQWLIFDECNSMKIDGQLD